MKCHSMRWHSQASLSQTVHKYSTYSVHNTEYPRSIQNPSFIENQTKNRDQLSSCLGPATTTTTSPTLHDPVSQVVSTCTVFKDHPCPSTGRHRRQVCGRGKKEGKNATPINTGMLATPSRTALGFPALVPPSLPLSPSHPWLNDARDVMGGDGRADPKDFFGVSLPPQKRRTDTGWYAGVSS